MQINAAQLSTVYASKPDLQEKLRVPVTIDVEQFKVEGNTAKSPGVTYPSNKNRVFNDAEQAQFIRSFSINGESSADKNNQPKQSELSLPKGVQQYLQIDNISNISTQKIFDETA